mgnify:CR=1 FL=1
MINQLDLDEIRKEWVKNHRFDAAYWMAEVLEALEAYLWSERGAIPGDCSVIPVEENGRLVGTVELRVMSKEEAYRQNWARIFGK